MQRDPPRLPMQEPKELSMLLPLPLPMRHLLAQRRRGSGHTQSCPVLRGSLLPGPFQGAPQRRQAQRRDEGQEGERRHFPFPYAQPPYNLASPPSPPHCYSHHDRLCLARRQSAEDSLERPEPWYVATGPCPPSPRPAPLHPRGTPGRSSPCPPCHWANCCSPAVAVNVCRVPSCCGPGYT